MGLDYWLTPYTANKTTKTTHIYIHQVGSQPAPPGQYAQVQYVQQQGQHVHVYNQHQQGGIVRPPPLQQQPVHQQQPVYHQPLPQQHVPYQHPVQQQQPVYHHQQPVNHQTLNHQPVYQYPLTQPSHTQVPTTPQPHYQHPSPSISSQYPQPSTPSTQYAQSVPSTPYMAHPPPSYSSPAPHHISLLTQPFPSEKLPAQPAHNLYDDKKPPPTHFLNATPKPMTMPEPAKTSPLKPMAMPEPATPIQKPMSMPEPVKTPLHKPMSIPGPAKAPLNKLETSISSNATEKARPVKQQETVAAPRNPQFVAPVYRNPQAIYDGPAISTSATSHPTLTHSQSASSSHGSTTSQPYKPQPYQPQPYRPSSTQTPSASTQSSSSRNSFVNSFDSMSISGRSNSSSSTVAARKFVDSKDDVPRLFLIAPTFEEPLIKGPYKPIRILLPCQAPSVSRGDEDAVHMTSHNGYTIKNPNDFMHNNKDAVKMMGTLTSYFAIAANIVNGIQGIPGQGGVDLVAQVAGSVANTVDNRTHLNNTGLDTSSLFEKHMATENHQREALKILLRAASASDPTQSMTGELNGVVLNNGRTIWVCKECYDSMLKGEQIKSDYHVSLSDYENLTRRAPTVNVMLKDSASLIIFTGALRNHPRPQKVTIRIAPEYFEAPERSHRAALASYQSLFGDLAATIYRHRVTSLELHGKSDKGYTYVHMQDVLKCASLEHLTITGMPLFLQGTETPKDCKMLTRLVLDGVRVDSEQAANNLRSLVLMNQSLTYLRLTRAGFTPISLDVLVLDANKQNQNLFKKLHYLNISDNCLDVVAATTLVAMAFKNNDLTHLDISGNSRIGDSGCRAILTLLRERSSKLVEFNTDRTGIERRTREEIKQLLNSPR
ncbi:hypothetical protein BGX20_008615 [Mortierella sp. AD010]|nr:hypothetical protein BGX20_008615 [Mortierella sp. AD010]